MMTRRSALSLITTTTACLAHPAFAAAAREITWDDLIPPGVPYSEIIGEGEMDVERDFWDPIYDENGKKLNEALDGSYIKMPGFIVPFDMTAEGVKEFMLVPYTGACIHVPPPPANQLVVATSRVVWPTQDLWAPVWVTGTLRTQLQSTNLGETGYALAVDEIETYEW